MLKKAFFLYLLLLHKLFVFSQQMHFENISSNLNLPSQECYNVLQDAKGYIWFSTEQGLCRYNGEKLLIYNEKNGLPEKAVYAIEKDNEGKVWFITAANRILYIENGEIKEAAFSENFKRASLGRTVISFAFINDHKMSVSLQANGTFLIDMYTNTCTEIQKTQSCYDYNVNLFHQKLVAFDGVVNDRSLPDAGILTRLNYFVNGNLKKVIPVPQTKASARSAFLLTCSKNDTHYAAFMQSLVILKPDGTHAVHQFPSTILSIYIDQQGGLWVGTLLKGLFYYKNANLDSKPLNSLTLYSVTRIIQDDERNIWCTTLEKGLFFCKNKDIWSYDIGNMQQNPEVLTYLDSTVYVGWQKKIFTFAGDSVSQLLFDVKEIDYITDMVFFNNKYYVSSYSFLVETDKNFRRISRVRHKHSSYNSVAKQFKIADGRLYALTSSYIGEIKDHIWEFHKSNPSMPLGRCFEPLGNNRFLFGAKDGMWQLTWVGDSSIAIHIPGIMHPVSDIITGRDGQVLVTTKGEGLFSYTNGKMVSINHQFKISALILFEIVQDVGGRYWISSNEGLFCCTMQGDSIHTVLYNTLDGLPANEIHKLAVTPDRIFFSSIYGVSSLPLNIEEEHTADPKIHLSGLQINNIPISHENMPNQLAYDHNTFKFSFDVISFKNNQHHIVYRLKGRDQLFVHANTTQLVAENLLPGDYELMVYAENEKGIRSIKPFIYHFSIAKPFWLTWWFIGTMLLGMTLLFIFILRLFIYRVHSRAEEKNRINSLLAESQLTAIQAQMNPHFVFNAINSIQNYILKNQKEEAYNYLAKFSHLIRMVLNNSQKKILPLAKELEVLTLYVELEQLRFKQSFEFEVQVSESIDEYEISLPPMLIQPILENAIWHGLMPLKNHKGKLRLLFSIENGLCKIVIEDNGIGREESFKNKMNVDHHSMALDLVKERIRMVKQLYQSMEEAYMNIVDLFDEKHRAAGTRVEIYLPIL